MCDLSHVQENMISESLSMKIETLSKFWTVGSKWSYKIGNILPILSRFDDVLAQKSTFKLPNEIIIPSLVIVRENLFGIWLKKTTFTI